MTPRPHRFLLWWSRILASPFIGIGLLCSVIVANVLYEHDPLMIWLKGLDQPPRK